MATRNLRDNLSAATKAELQHQEALAREIARNYAAALDKIRADLSRVFEKYSTDGVLTHAEMTKFNRLRALRNQILRDVRPAMLENKELLENIARVQYEEAFYRKAWAFDQAVGVDLGWGALDTKTVEAAVKNKFLGEALSRLSTVQDRRLRDSIVQGLIRGQSLPGMVANIKEAIGATTSDAMRIARTEAHRAREIANLDTSRAAEDIGVKVVRVWDAALDSRTRPSHARLDGKKAAPDESFPGGPVAPGQWGLAGEDINCRCTVTDTIEGYEPQLRRARDEGLQPYQTFETWAKERGVTASRYGQQYNFVRS